MIYTEDILKEVDTKMKNMKVKRSIINTKNASCLKDKIKKQLNLDMFPAIFKENTNFHAYPEAYRLHIYLKGKDNNYFVVYLLDRIENYLKKFHKLKLVKGDSGYELDVIKVEVTEKGD